MNANEMASQHHGQKAAGSLAEQTHYQVLLQLTRQFQFIAKLSNTTNTVLADDFIGISTENGIYWNTRQIIVEYSGLIC